MLKVSLRLNPIRMILGQKQPVMLDLIIKNESPESKLVSARVKLPDMLGFDGSCLIKEERRRLGFIKSGTEKVITFKLSAKSIISEGEYPIYADAYEHPPDRYDKIDNKYDKKTELRVIK